LINYGWYLLSKKEGCTIEICYAVPPDKSFYGLKYENKLNERDVLRMGQGKRI